jgi:hypothetical protein
MQPPVSAPYIVLEASYISVSVYTNSFLGVAVSPLVFLLPHNVRSPAAAYASASYS